MVARNRAAPRRKSRPHLIFCRICLSLPFFFCFTTTLCGPGREYEKNPRRPSLGRRGVYEKGRVLPARVTSRS